MARQIVVSWVLTIPGAAVMAWLAYEIARLVVGF